MLEVVQNLGLGFSVALSPPLLLYAFVGCVIGTLVGVLPGVGPLAGISLLLPATFGMDATRAIVMLAGIYYGAMYGGSTTSILMRIPGEAASVMTCIDGYAMARKGRRGSLRRGGDPGHGGRADAARGHQAAATRPAALARGVARVGVADRARQRARLPDRHPSRLRAHHRELRVVRGGEARVATPARVRPRSGRRGGRPRVRGQLGDLPRVRPDAGARRAGGPDSRRDVRRPHGARRGAR